MDECLRPAKESLHASDTAPAARKALAALLMLGGQARAASRDGGIGLRQAERQDLQFDLRLDKSVIVPTR